MFSRQICLLAAVLFISLVDGLASSGGGAQALRVLVDRKSPAALVLGIFDSFSAKIFSEAGADALFLSGFGLTASRLGMPDVGVISLSELVDSTANCVEAAAGVPVIVDGDTGFGGVANVRRTVRALANAGAAAVIIEEADGVAAAVV